MVDHLAVELCQGLPLGHATIHLLLYAYDVVLLAKSEFELEIYVNRLAAYAQVINQRHKDAGEGFEKGTEPSGRHPGLC